MKKILTLVFIFLYIVPSFGQEDKSNLFKSIYKDFLKYGTIYAAGDISNSLKQLNPLIF